MHTINELIRIIEDKQQRINNNSRKERYSLIKQELLNMKNAPELKGSCNIDFKLSNSDEYLERINKI